MYVEISEQNKMIGCFEIFCAEKSLLNQVTVSLDLMMD
uniref:Uncharacterized protein n=1 Tax=Anguilla anguilla TaxID=7936 RepID=A0A0E9V943_ANGAN